MELSDTEARKGKTLLGGNPKQQPSWTVWTVMKAFRVILLTVLWAALGMGAGLFCGILGVLAISAVRHVSPDMSLAYRRVSIPLAIVCGSVALLWNLFRTVQAADVERKARREQARPA